MKIFRHPHLLTAAFSQRNDHPRGERPGPSRTANPRTAAQAGQSARYPQRHAATALVGHPDPMAERTSLTLTEVMSGMTENVFINIKNKSKAITAEIEVPAGTVAGGGLAKGVTATLFINGKKAGASRLGRTPPVICSADEPADVGMDLATPVVASLGSGSKSKSPAAFRK